MGLVRRKGLKAFLAEGSLLTKMQPYSPSPSCTRSEGGFHHTHMHTRTHTCTHIPYVGLIAVVLPGQVPG